MDTEQLHDLRMMSTHIRSFFPVLRLCSRGLFLEAPGNYRARKAVLFSIPDGSFKTFENYTVKFLAKESKETKWTSLEVRIHPTTYRVFRETGPRVGLLESRLTLTLG